MVRFDPEKAINLYEPNPQAGYALIGHFGPFPSRPCDVCGAEEFRGMDWNLGYWCLNGHMFGSKDEWAWDQGKFHGTKGVNPCANCGSMNNNGMSCFSCHASDTDE